MAPTLRSPAVTPSATTPKVLIALAVAALFAAIVLYIYSGSTTRHVVVAPAPPQQSSESGGGTSCSAAVGELRQQVSTLLKEQAAQREREAQWQQQLQAAEQQRQRLERQQDIVQRMGPPELLGEGRMTGAVPAMRIAIDPNASGSGPGTYPQVGYLVPGGVRAEAGHQLLPLYGRESMTRRGRWYYYVIAAGGIKVPVVRAGRDCMTEIGCDELYDGDVVSAPDAGLGSQPLTVRIYRLGGTRV